MRHWTYPVYIFKSPKKHQNKTALCELLHLPPPKDILRRCTAFDIESLRLVVLHGVRPPKGAMLLAVLTLKGATLMLLTLRGAMLMLLTLKGAVMVLLTLKGPM